jgi:hypothetical protein
MTDLVGQSERETLLVRKRQQFQDYYRLHRDEILAKQRKANAAKYWCPCGAHVGVTRREAHESSQKHGRYEVWMARLSEERSLVSEQLRLAGA